LIGLNPLAKVIIVSGNSERSNALLAVEKGAHDIFPKPVDLDELKVVLHRVYRRIELEKESIEERKLAQRVSFEEIIGSSPQMQEIFVTLRKVAGTDVPVLITGESGTGKELIANAVHSLSKRKNGPFVTINCGAIPDTLLESELFGHEKGSFTGAGTQRKGKLEYANGGTLFLDEIGDLLPELQVKILRFLQEKVIERVGGRQLIPVDSRVIAATNQDLESEVKANRFREDLYFRLAVVTIAVPPLRERGNDVIQLAEHLVLAFSKELKRPPKKLSKSALEAIRKHEWPGNVRELQNRVKRALVLADGPTIGPSELELETLNGNSGASASTLKEAKEALEREILANALRENNGNISKTAKALGISRPTLYDLISRHGL
jgi:two-component system NtrC family response regulator